ncbi:MAG: RluA family pseudouridine synthase [Myxococcales bacterium]|nr:RluA family pseudouridine synthase [Myxococcales bacterium]MCB9526345.1 RluA family pseudouridine synthase [Myxococcales bacterium]
MQTPEVLTERAGVWAVLKPAGWRMHPAGDDPTPTLTDWLEAQAPGLRPAHRLDQGTSGLVLCAVDPALRGALGKAFQEGRVSKTYLALVYGRARRKGIVRKPLADGRRGRPLPAVTRYGLAEWVGAFSLLRVRPETGRKHQIRRHLAGIGHPLVGDDRYGPGQRRPVPAFPGRLWLHAHRLVWTRADGETLVFEAPLPQDLEAHLQALRESA